MYLEKASYIQVLVEEPDNYEKVIEVQIRGNKEKRDILVDDFQVLFDINTTEEIDKLEMTKIFIGAEEGLNNVKRWIRNYLEIMNRKEEEN